MDKPQELTITLRFPVKMSPDNKNHLMFVAKNYINQKGIKCWEENNELIME